MVLRWGLGGYWRKVTFAELESRNVTLTPGLAICRMVFFLCLSQLGPTAPARFGSAHSVWRRPHKYLKMESEARLMIKRKHAIQG